MWQVESAEWERAGVEVGGLSRLGQHEQRHRGVEAHGCPGGFSELCQRAAVCKTRIEEARPREDKVVPLGPMGVGLTVCLSRGGRRG